MSRPEAATGGRADKFYSSSEAASYSQSNRLRRVQLSLDIGCGTGISGVPLSRAGHMWVGTDISTSMLDVAVAERGPRGTDVMVSDMGHGLPFRDHSFDGAISVSAIQWLCYEAKHHKKTPRDRLRAFFKDLRKLLRPGARAVLQFYPEQPEDATQICDAAIHCGFSGGVVVDYPGDLNAKKYYLVVESLPKEAWTKIIKAVEEAKKDER